MTKSTRQRGKRRLRVAGLFAGIGGVERGFEQTGRFRTVLLSENDPGASAVLAARFPRVSNEGDIRDLERLPPATDVVTGGFPCQDLSQAGGTRGIEGEQSSLVGHVFRLLEDRPVPWVVLENVPFMLQLNRGSAIRHVVDRLEALGYAWAYRVLDSRAFGLPQRRQRVFLIASRAVDPSTLLFAEDAGPAPEPKLRNGHACGFYWTEGVRGLGWAVDATPTLKGGSTVSIPSPPAVWMPDGGIVTPTIEAAERLQGFNSGWTAPAEQAARCRPGHRWKLVGNAVSVQVANWVARSITGVPRNELDVGMWKLREGHAWPKAAFGHDRVRYGVDVSEWPVREPRIPLDELLGKDIKPLSERATRGFLGRFESSSLRKPEGFIRALHNHLEAVEQR